MKAKDYLEQLRKTPRMFASNKESFCAQVLTALIMDDVEFNMTGPGSSGGNFYAKHIGHQGSAIIGCNDPFDDEWAHSVVDDALSFIKE